MKKKLLLALKIVVSIFLIYLVSRQIDWENTGKLILELSPISLLGAFLLLNSSQFVSVRRINLFYQDLGIQFPFLQQARLYYVGMFYNIFVPGGIGGDAYKIYWLKRKNERVSNKSLIQTSLADRLGGLGGILIVLVLTFFLTPLRENTLYTTLAIATGVVGIPALGFFIRYVLSAGYPTFWKTLLPSVLVQLLQIGSICLLLLSWGITGNYELFAFIFLVSSLASVIPITIAGAGAREITFSFFSTLFVIDENVAVTTGLMFFLLTLLSSLIGGFLKV
ncbi:MAG: lysylphosphatidylglycerol synthase transmembrane domain-containing protein [Bacteroidota bacterium]